MRILQKRITPQAVTIPKGTFDAWTAYLTMILSSKPGSFRADEQHVQERRVFTTP